ncbi:MAG: hypothetical protein M1825_001249 [Sarcosagium campestre]|nr:MAG: hypothetical protein M1825_001249 [Sarcosagium campestre]
MDAQVEQAIEIAWNPTHDQNLQRQAVDFLESLRSEGTGWQVCLALFTRLPKASEVVRHVSLEIVNHSIQSNRLDTQGLTYVRDELRQYATKVYGGLSAEIEVDSSMIQNKLTQTFTYLFTALYSRGWESFFDDFLALTYSSGTTERSNLAGSMLYLRMAGSIHDEIADVLVSRGPDLVRRNNELKDLIRQRDLQKNTACWQDLLLYWRDRNDAIVDLCLRIIGRWVVWIDIALVVNDGILPSIFALIGRNTSQNSAESTDKIRVTAIETLTEIISKKMKADDKLQLIAFLDLGNVIAQLVASPALSEMRATSSYDTDLAEAVSKLVNGATYDIVKAFESEPSSAQTRQGATELLQAFVPFLLHFFADEYDEICSTVIPSLGELLTFFRREVKVNGALSQDYHAMVPPILNAIILKMRYDETFEWGNDDEETDEAEFQELRRKLHVLQQGIADIDEIVYIDVVSSVVGQAFDTFTQNGRQADWRDLDLALHEMFLFGEVAVKRVGLFVKGQPSGPAAERLVIMMIKMIEADIANVSHPAIQLQYMEIAVRYAAFFEVHTQFLPQALENFVRFVHYDHVRVRTRSWYLFHRFVRQLRNSLGDAATTVSEALADLLVITAELPKTSPGDNEMSSDDGEETTDATFNSQLFLFEAVGELSSSPSVAANNQALHAQRLTSPLRADLELSLERARNGNELATLQIHHDIMALGALAQAFSNSGPGQNPNVAAPSVEVADQFERCAEIILVALESLKTSLNIRTAARSAFSRFVKVLRARILPQLPRWIDGLLSQSSSKDEVSMFLRLLDQVVYEFKTEIHSFLDALLTPLLQRVFAALGETSLGTDDEIQLKELRRQYLNLLLVILNNNLGSVLVSSSNQNTFETLITTIEHFATDAKDVLTAKLALSVLTNMSTCWGGPNLVDLPGATATAGAQNANGTDANATTIAPPLPGFSQFMVERFTPPGWTLPTNASLNPKDAQTRQAFGEAATLQRAIYTKTGDDYLVYLRDVTFPRLGIDQTGGEEYRRALQEKDVRGFKHYFLDLIQRLRQ